MNDIHNDTSFKGVSMFEKGGGGYPYRRITTIEELKQADAYDEQQQQNGNEKVLTLSSSFSSSSLSSDQQPNNDDDVNSDSDVIGNNENNKQEIGMLLLKNNHQNNTSMSTRTKHQLPQDHQDQKSLQEYKEEHKMKEAEEELTKRAQKRQMTSNQELWNAITMIPTPLFCLYFCLSGIWLTQSDIDRVSFSSSYSDWESTFDSSSSSSSPCIQSSLFPNLHALPPPTVLASALACILHSPCSMYYHLLCAYKLPPGPKRMDHWARRLDQAMIHFMSFLMAYSTSANFDYLLISLAFNIDCMYRLFQKGMRPRRTLIRMVCAFLIPVLPFVVRGNFMDLFRLVVIYSVSMWLFSAYPLGGWSHGFFHLICFLSNPIIIASSLKLDADVVRDYVDTAAQCFLKVNDNKV